MEDAPGVAQISNVCDLKDFYGSLFSSCSNVNDIAFRVDDICSK